MSISFTKKVNTEFLKAINDFRMLERDGRSVKSVLIGYSGGADSSALLMLLRDYSDANQLGLKIFAVHVNHMIRGEEADSDSAFCERIAKAAGVEFISKKINVPEIAQETGVGLEEAARNVRYDLFSRLADELDIDVIATAHNSSDNLETVLFNLTRGTGINGLCGIPPIRKNIIRPLIYCSKSDILGYCEENGIEYVTDSTNSDTAYTRNYIRNVIVPEIRHLNEDVESAVIRMCSLLRKDKALLEDMAAANALPQNVEVLKETDDALLGRILQNSYKSAGGREPLDYERTIEIENLIKVGAETKVSLHGKIDFIIEKGKAFFEKHKTAQTVQFRYKLKPGINDITEDDSVIFLSENSEPNDDEKNIIKLLKNVYKLSIHNILYFDKITNEVFARSRAEGDKIKAGKMTKSIKKLLQSSEIPKDERQTLPFICDNEGIILIPRICRADRVSDKLNKQALNIWYFKGKKDIK